MRKTILHALCIAAIVTNAVHALVCNLCAIVSLNRLMNQFALRMAAANLHVLLCVLSFCMFVTCLPELTSMTCGECWEQLRLRFVVQSTTHKLVICFENVRAKALTNEM